MGKTTCSIDIQKQIETLNNHIEKMCMAKNMQEFVTLCESVHFDLNKIIAINKEETKIEKDIHTNYSDEDMYSINKKKQKEMLNAHIEKMCAAKDMLEFTILCEFAEFNLNRIIAINLDRINNSKKSIEI